MYRTITRSIAIAAAFTGTGAVAAVPTPQNVRALRASRGIVLDGRLDDADWRRAPALDRLWEYFPKNQAEPPERTEARFLYDDKYLYVGFELLLKDPSTLRKPFVRRDKVGSSHDYVQVYLDPQGSGQTATLFRVNARGTQTDGVQDEAKQTESTDPDFEWEERSAIVPGGWSAELRIPLSTLRVSKTGSQAWNVVVTRGVPRDQNTQMATAPWPRNGSCFQCLASKLEFGDLRANAEHIIVEPAIVATARRDRGSFGRGSAVHLDPGVDAKWLPFAGAAVDVTVNPDFSQVETDSPQLTANQRFAIDLPEKRPFFREGSDLIATPLPILYTRTITAPDYGMRFTERSASLSGTAFVARDGGRGVIIEPGLLSSAAGLPDFGSKVGFAHVTDRMGWALLGGLAAAKLNDDGSGNELGGFDAAWQNSTDRLVGQGLVSRTRNPDRPDLLPQWHGQRMSGAAMLGQWDHTGSYVSTLRYQRFGEGFRSWLGFVPRVGFEEMYGLFRRDFYPSALSKLVNRVGPYVSYQRLNALGRAGTEQDATLGVEIDATKASFVDLSWHPVKQVLTEQGDERRFSQFAWKAQVSPSPRFPLVAFSGTVGRDVDYADGQIVPLTSISATLRSQPFDRLQIEARYSALSLGGASAGGKRLTETIPELLATYFFGPAFYVLADLQEHRAVRRYPATDRTRSTLASLQFVWEPLLSWRGYFGVRAGRLHPLDPQERGSSTEVYFKLVRRIAL